jgi:uncharacterized protein YbcC (UPF0753/DUF2309 family)
MGTVKVNTPITNENESSIINDVLQYIKENHENIQIEEKSLDLSKLKQGEISFMTSAGINGKNIVTSAIKKKLDKKKIEKALDSFRSKLNIDDLPSANQEIYDLMEVAHFTPKEQIQFINTIKKEMGLKGISLNILN